MWFIGLQCIVCTLLNEWMNICLWYHTPHKIAHFLLLYSQAKLSGVKKTGCEENLFNWTKEIALRGISSTTSYTYRSLPLANSLCLLFHCICCPLPQWWSHGRLFGFIVFASSLKQTFFKRLLRSSHVLWKHSYKSTHMFVGNY